MLASEIPAGRLHSFVSSLAASGVDPEHERIPAIVPQDEDGIRKLALRLLSSAKGAGWSVHLLEDCDSSELPTTAVAFLKSVYAFFPASNPIAAALSSAPGQINPESSSSMPPSGNPG